MNYFIFLCFYLLLQIIGINSNGKAKNATRFTKERSNVLGTALEICSLDPLTGWFRWPWYCTLVLRIFCLISRDGYCRTDDNDHGVHVVCATMTENFLAFTKSRGNDLSSRRGGFPGLSPGDRWCLCAVRWREAFVAGAAPLVVLPATHHKAHHLVFKTSYDWFSCDNW